MNYAVSVSSIMPGTLGATGAEQRRVVIIYRGNDVPGVHR